LGNRSFQLLISGQFASTAGDYCYAVALPWYVLSLHGGSLTLGAVLACYGIPRVALIPVGGYLADKLGSRPVMLGADVIRGAFVALLAVLAGGHVTSWFALGAVAAVIGGGEGLFIPASFTIVPFLVDAGQLASANAFSMAALQAGSLLGPVLGGALVAGAGPVWAFAADALSFAVSGLTLVLLAPADHRHDAEPGAAGGPGAPADGPGVLGLLWNSRGLQVVLMILIVANLAWGGLSEVAWPSLAHARFGADGYGVMLACMAAGSVLGTLAGARCGELRRPIIFSAQVVLVEAAAMAAAPFLGGLAGLAVALAVEGAANGLSLVIFRTVVQNWTPRPLLGRMMSLLMLCALGSFPLSVAIGGVVVHRFGPVGFFPLAGGLVAVAMLAGLAQRQFRVFADPGDPVPGPRLPVPVREQAASSPGAPHRGGGLPASDPGLGAGALDAAEKLPHAGRTGAASAPGLAGGRGRRSDKPFGGS
jgi:MFS family permease